MRSTDANNTHIEAGALVVNKAGEFLVLVGSDGLWSLPKGHVDYGETPAQAACREVLEETHIQSSAVCVLRRFQFHRRKQLYDLTVYLASSDGGNAADTEHANAWATWFTLEDAFAVPTYDSRYRDCIADFLRFVEAHDGHWLLCEKADDQEPIPADQAQLLEGRLGASQNLRPLNHGAKRPLFAIEGCSKTARLMESAERAQRSARTVQMMQAPEMPAVEALGRWLIAGFVPGTPLVELPRESVEKAHLEAAGQLLAAIHGSPLPSEDRAQGFAKAVAYIRKTAQRSLDALERTGFIAKADRVLIEERLEQWCGEGLSPQMLACTHWDYVPSNIIIAGERAYVVDFEGARLFFPSYDLAKALHYLEYFGFDTSAFVDSYVRAGGGSAVRDLDQMKLFFYVRCLAKRLGKPHLDHRPIEAKLWEVLYGQRDS